MLRIDRNNSAEVRDYDLLDLYCGGQVVPAEDLGKHIQFLRDQCRDLTSAAHSLRAEHERQMRQLRAVHHR